MKRTTCGVAVLLLKTKSFWAFQMCQSSTAVPACQTLAAAAGGRGSFQMKKLPTGMVTPSAAHLANMISNMVSWLEWCILLFSFPYSPVVSLPSVL
jgi:hypothetical protein